MKVDRLTIRLIIGFVFLAILSIVILLIRPKEENQINGVYYPRNNINIIQDDKNSTENKEKMTKDQLFLLLDNGMRTSYTVNLFEYFKELFSNDEITPIFKREEYSNIMKDININQYRDDRFDFITMQNTSEYVWGYFLDKNDDITYIIVDKTNGRIRNLNNKMMEIIID